MKNTMKKVVAVLVCVCCAVSLFAFSASADEVIFNGTLTFDVDGSAYLFPSYISLTAGDTYSLTYNGVTDTAQVNPPDDIPAPYAVFYNIGCILLSGDIGNGDQTAIIWQSEESPATIDIILSKASGSDQSQDQVILQQNVRFENLAGSYSGAVVNPGFNFIPNREYLVEVNGISRQYTAITFDDVGVVVGANPPADGEFTLGITEGGGINGGDATLLINADNLITLAGTYPVKITLLGIKPPHFSDQIGSFASNMFSVIGISASSIGSNSILSIFLIGLPLLFIVIGILFTLLNRKKNRGQRGYYKRYKRR